MRQAMLLVNGFFVIFSFIWLVGHSTVRMFDWEFWFALVYLLLCTANVVYLVKQDRAELRAGKLTEDNG